MDSSTLPPIPPDIIGITAPQLIGSLFNWALWGVLSVQVYVYYLNFPDDKKWNKVLVYGTYLFEVAQTSMNGADLYFWFASGYGNLNHLGTVNISWVDTPIQCGIIAAVVQCFFAYRIYTLRRSYLWICIVIVFLALVQTAGALAAGITAFQLQDFARFRQNVIANQWRQSLWLLGDTVCDVFIAGTMLWLFYKSRQEGLKHTNKILGRLVRLVIETNSLSAGMALISYVCYVALPGNNVFISTTLIMGKLYSNTLLVTFNNRIALRKINMHDDINYESRGTERPPIGQAEGFNSNATTFRVPSDKFGGIAAGLESYQLATLTENKARELTSVV